jgi:hypothetical protein
MMNNPSGAVSLAKMVAKQTPPPVDINTMADLFLQVGQAALVLKSGLCVHSW